MIINPFRFAVAGAGASARYWKVDVTNANGSNNLVVIAEIYFVNNTVDVSTAGKTITASSDFFGIYPGSLAFDGNTSTEWTTSNVGNGWVKVDFGSATAIDQIDIYISTGSSGASPNDYTVQYSNDDSSWTTVVTVTDRTIPGWTLDARANTSTW